MTNLASTPVTDDETAKPSVVEHDGQWSESCAAMTAAYVTRIPASGLEPTPNAIEVYVSRLRAKIETAGVRIRTVRGFGYLWETMDD